VISAEADGHVVLFGTAGTQAVAPALNPGIGFDPRDDLVPVTRIGVTPNLLVVHPSLPAKTVAELIALAKAQPGQLAYASSGTGTVSHLSAALFARMAGIDLNHIPYRGAGPANNDLLAGQVKMMFDSPISLLPLVNADKLRVLAVTSAGRLPFLPAIPTLAESGFPGYLSEIWLGVFAPKGTPQPVVAKLHAAFAAAVGAPEVQARMMQLGFAPNLGDGPALGAILRQDFERWSAVIKATGIPAQ